MTTATIETPARDTFRLLAFHGDGAVKRFYLDRVAGHRAADEIVQGQYWRDGKGCGVGCTIHGSDHHRYEDELGIPAGLAHLEDVIFEGLPLAIARDWPYRFLAAIPVGADLTPVTHRFLAWLLEEEVPSHLRAGDPAPVKNVLARVAGLHRRAFAGAVVPDEEWAAARDAARAVAGTVDPAAGAARAAEWAAIDAAAGVAVDAAVGVAVDAAWAGLAAVVAARAAVDAAADAARSAWLRISDQLIEILETA